MLTNDQICDIIDSYVRGRNAERNRRILKRRLIDGVTLEALAEEYELSVTQIKEIIHKTSILLKDHLSV